MRNSDQKSILCNLSLNKSMFSPGEEVFLTLDLLNKGKDIDVGFIKIQLWHLEEKVGDPKIKTFTLKHDSSLNKKVILDFPEVDFKGYIIEVGIFDNDIKLDSNTIGIDISSTWVKFPRYGYVWDFRSGVNTTERVEKLKDYHINALEYYDWKYRHHKPVPEDMDIWDDWSGREINGEIIRNYISDAKKFNMVNMAYNMIYAATEGYEEDGVKKEWALFFAEDNPRGEGQFTFKMSDSSPTGITHLYFLDPSNKDWQEYIFKQQNKVFETFDFDGWHGDTVGDWGKMKTFNGREVYVKDTYTEFLNAAKKAIGDKFLAFNPVGAQGIENVNRSNVDVLYAEIWPWDRDSEGELYNDYYSLKKEVEQSRKESGGKSLIVPAYMCYEYGQSHPGEFFNTAAVVLTSSTVYAAGGSRIELGDNGNMLCHEYFPAQSLKMSEELQTRMKKLYDFIVAYENLLRDGQTETENNIEVLGYKHSHLGDPNSIWVYGKRDEQYEIIQMINLLGVSNNDWRASHGEKETPTKVENFDVKYYFTKKIQKVFIASPDANGGLTNELTFIEGEDEKGSYIQFTIPSLEYWNMIYMKKES